MAITGKKFAKLGMDCQFKLNGTLVENVQDVTINYTCEEADTTTRGNGGWKQTQPTLKECSIECTVLEIEDDTTYTTLNSAFNATELEDRFVLVEVEGMKGYFGITNFTREESLTEAVKINVTLKLQQKTS